MIFDREHFIEQLTWAGKEFLSCKCQMEDTTVSIANIMAFLAMMIWLDIIRMVVVDTFKCLRYCISIAFPICAKTWRQLECQVGRNVGAHSRVHVATWVGYISLFIHAVYFSDRASHSAS